MLSPREIVDRLNNMEVKKSSTVVKNVKSPSKGKITM